MINPNIVVTIITITMVAPQPFCGLGISFLSFATHASMVSFASFSPFKYKVPFIIFGKFNITDEEILVDEVPTAYILDGDRILRSAPVNYQSAILAVRSNIHTLPKKIYESLISSLNNNTAP